MMQGVELRPEHAAFEEQRLGDRSTLLRRVGVLAHIGQREAGIATGAKPTPGPAGFIFSLVARLVFLISNTMIVQTITNT